MLFIKKKICVNVLSLSGVIASSGRKSLSLQNTKKNIDKAFEGKKNTVVAVVINSPGGSPVQSEMIANYVMDKSAEKNIKVITFVEDVAASGGYWLALMGDEIYALSKSSIVGSLGVLYASFGLEDFIKQHNIKRRVHTAGKNKVSLDMFQEEKEEDVVRLKEMLFEVHTHFKDWVLRRREQKIKLPQEDLFSGQFWVASKGLEHGLIDGICNLESKLKELYGNKVKINYIEQKKGWFSSLLGVFKGNDDLLDSAFSKIKSESLWNKFGL